MTTDAEWWTYVTTWQPWMGKTLTLMLVLVLINAAIWAWAERMNRRKR